MASFFDRPLGRSHKTTKDRASSDLGRAASGDRLVDDVSELARAVVQSCAALDPGSAQDAIDVELVRLSRSR
jgi:hypothetical protein